jgi:hypothetical protein
MIKSTMNSPVKLNSLPFLKKRIYSSSIPIFASHASAFVLVRFVNILRFKGIVQRKVR